MDYFSRPEDAQFKADGDATVDDAVSTGSVGDVLSSTRNNRELHAMVRIASTILQHTNLDDILSAITRELAMVIDFDRSSIAFMTPNKKELVLQHIHKRGGGEDKFGEGRTIPLDETSVIGWVVQNRRAVLRRDILTDGRFREIVEEEQLRSDMVVPLIARGNVIGTLNVGSHEAGQLGDSDLQMLVNCGNLACGAIEHALLLQEAKDLGERYRTLQRNASDIIMIVDRSSGRIVEVNRKCCDALGLTEGKLLQKSFFDLFPIEDQVQARRDFINVLSKKNRTFVDRRLVANDGNTLYVDISASLIEIKSDTFIQALVHDISQRKMLEQQIVMQNRNLQDANRKLREVDQMKTEFLANISHELRTPLSIIIAYTDSLREMDLSREDQSQFLGVISENGEHLLSLINDLLDLSRLEITGAMLTTSLSHIHDVIRSVWPRALKSATEKSVALSFQPGEVPVVYIDNKRMLQVVSCLIHNAIKFTAKGGQVTVVTSRRPDGVWVEVRDTGAGIPAEQISCIFDTFRQLDGSSTRKWGGLGIGLAMARHIVELHGGRIFVESREGEGSCFTVVVPADTEHIARDEVRRSAAPAPSPPALREPEKV